MINLKRITIKRATFLYLFSKMYDETSINVYHSNKVPMLPANTFVVSTGGQHSKLPRKFRREM